MNPYQKYRQQEEPAGWTRIEMLLALFDKALERLDRAEASLATGNEIGAAGELAKTQIIVMTLASGVELSVDPQGGRNMLRLYEFVTNELRRPNAEGIANARKILHTLREGFESIRAEANALERSGQIPPLEQKQMVHATA
jgi:flagellar secretion chaperone FliS